MSKLTKVLQQTVYTLVMLCCLGANPLHAQSQPGSRLNESRPKVWIYTDMSDPSLRGREKEGSVNDPDDVSAMAGYLLMANEFNTLGIVVTSTHRNEHADSPNQAEWANKFFGEAYQADLPGLN